MKKSLAQEKFGYVVNVLLYLLNQEKPPTVMEFLEAKIVPRATFYNHLKDSLEKAGIVEFRVNPDRTITMHLTERGRKIAEALRSIEEKLKKARLIYCLKEIFLVRLCDRKQKIIASIEI